MLAMTSSLLPSTRNPAQNRTAFQSIQTITVFSPWAAERRWWHDAPPARSRDAPAGRRAAWLLCAALKSAREHRNAKQRAAAGHVERPLVGAAEAQILAAS